MSRGELNYYLVIRPSSPKSELCPVSSKEDNDYCAIFARMPITSLQISSSFSLNLVALDNIVFDTAPTPWFCLMRDGISLSKDCRLTLQSLILGAFILTNFEMFAVITEL